MTSCFVPSRRLVVAAGLVTAVLAGTVVAASATPSPQGSPGADVEPADEAAEAPGKAARKAAGRGRPPAVTGPAFACDPALSHGENVSAYARSLRQGPGRGRLVSQAARSDCGKPSAGD